MTPMCQHSITHEQTRTRGVFLHVDLAGLQSYIYIHTRHHQGNRLAFYVRVAHAGLIKHRNKNNSPITLLELFWAHFQSFTCSWANWKLFQVSSSYLLTRCLLGIDSLSWLTIDETRVSATRPRIHVRRWLARRVNHRYLIITVRMNYCTESEVDDHYSLSTRLFLSFRGFHFTLDLLRRAQAAPFNFNHVKVIFYSLLTCICYRSDYLNVHFPCRPLSISFPLLLRW